MIDYRIRAAQPHHLEQLNRLMYLLHDEHHQACPNDFKTAQEIEQEKSIARYLDAPDCLVYVAECEEKVIGFATGHFCDLVSTVSKPVAMGSVDELYVEIEHRQSGVASQLIERVIETFDDYGVQQVFVEVWNFNQQAISLYEKQGFSHHIHWLRKSLSK